LGLTAADLAAAIQAQNIQASIGQVGAPPAPEGTLLQYTLVAQGRLASEEEFGAIVVRTGEAGATIRLRDVARIELGASNYSADARLNGAETAMLSINQAPGANALETADRVLAEMERLSSTFPAGISYQTVYDATLFVRANVDQILRVLTEAFLIVLVITFLFLQNWRATLISALAIPVSLLGAMAMLFALGYSANTITLIALVLAIGLVVDDAILVVENVQRVLEEDSSLGPMEATRRAMEQITGPIIATTFVLLAVVVPTAFLPGINGQLYKQFAVTLSSALVVSAVVALTLSPALSALLLGGGRGAARRGPLHWFSQGLRRSRDAYGRSVARLVSLPLIPLSVLALASLAALWIFVSLPSTFLPDEDQGALFLDIQLPNAASLERTREILAQLEATLTTTEGVENVISVAGFSLLQGTITPSGGMAIVSLSPWEERESAELQLGAMIGRLQGAFSAIPEAN